MKKHLNDILILDFLNGSITPAERQSVQLHLDNCPDCRALYNDLLATWQTLGQWQPRVPAADLTSSIMQKARDYDRRLIKWPLWLPDAKTLVRTAASIALSLLIGHFAGRWSMPANDYPADKDIAQALYMDILSPATATGWGQIVLESETAQDTQE